MDTNTVVPPPEIEDNAIESYPIEINGIQLTQTEGTYEKGKKQGQLYYRLVLDTEQPNPFLPIIKAVSAENWFATVFKKVINQACDDATHEAFDETTGKVDQAKWEESFVKYFLPNSRGGGTKISELRDALTAKTEELRAEMPTAMKLAQGDLSVPDEDKNRYFRILAEWGELNTKVEGKKRHKKGEKK